MQFARGHSLQWLPVNPASSGFRVKPLALPHRRRYISRVQKHALGTTPETTIELNMRLRNSAVTEFAFNPKRHTLLTYNSLA